MNDLRSYSRHWIKEFIEIYKNEICLWKTKHSDYNNHILRSDAYEKLIHKLREVEQHPDRSMVVRKINSLRSAFRRELRKKRTIKGYEPRLWYFNILSFIDDQKVTRKSNITKHIDDNEEEGFIEEQDGITDNENHEIENIKQEEIRFIEIEEHSIDANDNQHLKGQQIGTISSIEQFQQQHENQLQQNQQNDIIQQSLSTASITTQGNLLNNHLNTNTNNNNNNNIHIQKADMKDPLKMVSFLDSSSIIKHDDEFDAIGTNVSHKLRGMKSTQRIIAEKLISDVLFNGQLDNLNVTSKLVN